MKYDVNYGYKVQVEILHYPKSHSKTVRVHAPFYMKKEFDLKMTYSDDFTDSQILRDSSFYKVMGQHFPPDR
jgi:hypothetical protein